MANINEEPGSIDTCDDKEEKDGPPGKTEDEKRMENINKLLMTVDTTEEQQLGIIIRYQIWLGNILTSEQKKMTLETPLTDGDCEFLRVLSIPAVTGQKELNWQNLSDLREIQRYEKLFLPLSDKYKYLRCEGIEEEGEEELDPVDDAVESPNPFLDRYVEYEDGPLVMIEETDEKRMENIKKLLMTVDTTEQRKCIVRQYLDWFMTILSTSEQKKMILETPLTDGDCEFLRVLSIPAVTGQIELNWQNLSDLREIYQYGLLFKRLFDFSDKGWDELQIILDAGR